MSTAEVLLPSPPIEGPRDHMSGLFHRSNQLDTSLNALSKTDGVESDSAARKRVEFQTWTTNIADVHLSTPGCESVPSLKSLPPSRTCQQTKRPILKTNISTDSVSTSDVQNRKRSGLADMESLLEQLAHNDRLSSLDAYQTIVSLIKTYEHPPEEAKMQEKMSSLQKYLKRDLLLLDKDNDELSSENRLSMQSLVVSAIKLLVTIVWVPAYAVCLSDDFRIWTLERAIQVIGDHTSKVIVLHYMHFLATQNYQDSILIGGKRALHLLEILHTLPERFSGKSVHAERLLIYQKLLDQAKPTMKAKADLWIGHLFTSMSHSFKDVRSNAISVGTRACTIFRDVDNITIEARKQLAQEKGERTLSNSITNRLDNMLVAKDEGNQIPQIWTIVVLLCNSDSQRLETWAQFQDWVRLIQRCFNCSDASIKTQAYMAWNRLYYIARPHQAPESILSLLAKPTVLQLERVGSSSSRGTRQAVISSFAMLLYYAFRPAVKPQQYTRVWNEYVVKIMTRSFLSKSASICDLCCRVLSSLFYSSLPGCLIWNEYRALENAPLDPLELPPIDCKWIRAHIPAILTIMGLLVQYSSFGPDGQVSEQAYVSQAWTHLMKAVRESSIKEIVTSSEMKNALIFITAFLGVPETRSTTDPDPSTLYPRLALLSKISVAELGQSLALSLLDSLKGTGHVMILKELFANAVNAQMKSDSPHPVHQKVIEQCLEKLCAELEADPSVFTLNASTSVIAHTCSPAICQNLAKVQGRLASILEDSCSDLTIGGKDAETKSSFQDLYEMVIKALAEVPLSSYHAFDDLIAALLSNDNGDLRTCFLRSWKVQAEKDEPYIYGPRLLDLCETLIDQLPSLPGVGEPITKASYSPTGLDSEKGPTSTDEPSVVSSSQMLNLTNHATTSPKGVTSADRSTKSDAHFESSNAGPVFQSQLLTSSNNERDGKQTSEVAISFADVKVGPLTEKKKKNTSPKPLSDRKRMSELDVTPTSPPNKIQEEMYDAPTPTPKARKVIQSDIRPDVASSPPSVGSEDELSGERDIITSSPVKDFGEAAGAIQLGQVNVPDVVRQAQKVQVLVPKLKKRKSTSPRQSQSQEAPSPELDLPDTAKVAHSSAQEVVEPEVSTPVSEVDEYDVLAASQLSQNLEEQSFVTGREVPSTPTSHAKRKYRDDPSIEEQKKKKRKSSEITQTEEAVDECITVQVDPSVTSSQESRSRKAGKRAKRRKSDRKVSSQEVHTTSSPAESSASASKSRTRSGRKSRSRHSSQETEASKESGQSPPLEVEGSVRETETPIPRGQGPPAEVERPAESIQPSHTDRERENDSELLSIASEVLETMQTEILVTPEPDDLGMNTDIVAQPQPHMEDEKQVSASNVISNLQEVLARMSGVSANEGPSGQELAAIHSLCFKIGLKAQEWASNAS